MSSSSRRGHARRPRKRDFPICVPPGQWGANSGNDTRGRRICLFDTLGAFIRDVGLPKFNVDMTGHEPGR